MDVVTSEGVPDGEVSDGQGMADQVGERGQHLVQVLQGIYDL